MISNKVIRSSDITGRVMTERIEVAMTREKVKILKKQTAIVARPKMQLKAIMCVNYLAFGMV